ncbi:Phospholipase D1 [Pseudogymnoascus destructans]|uniref:Phospholipase D1 n=1 Tax=Pseudogymnoascus destructans TaxID=655981 RepID=A0A176ZWU1_9PEZI|nr:Phospholipase D1 [Pseudogymnoascus destructans]OAF54247.1 Phospholipase D1 [Pseudogymnoascus destructans]
MAKHDDTSISHDAESCESIAGCKLYEHPAAFRHSGLRTELNTDGSTTTDLRPTFKDSSQPTTPRHAELREADDYMNGGLPHEFLGTPPPIASTEASAISRPSSIRQISAAPSVRGNGAIYSGNGTQTPPGRRSVQFARADSGDIAIPARWDVSDADGDPQGKGISLMSKLRALAITGGLNTHTEQKHG